MDDHPLSLAQSLQRLFQKLDVYFTFDILVDHVLARSQYIRQQQLISVPVHIQRFVDGHFQFDLAVPPQIHEDLIFDAPGSIGGKLYVFIGFECIDRLDQSDRPDGNQIFYSDTRIVELFCYVHDKP